MKSPGAGPSARRGCSGLPRKTGPGQGGGEKGGGFWGKFLGEKGERRARGDFIGSGGSGWGPGMGAAVGVGGGGLVGG